ncbi:tripartite ATP-independent transporter solute receptor, DctP family [Modicisalibacter muralis]|uniref:Tripartite ATP-independent transporter solute receptor, DctP family n=1 Tax=Modicisalibacter muralis TaxID=119000 RepID=A0A1G9M714_9GAMM|nr:TRAP transporter substrate-binding protein [Halomonas muralis]SDL69903.1 tripartite ATP-independent transporter solute receptor, DctP family [Halomonas muralis]
MKIMSIRHRFTVLLATCIMLAFAAAAAAASAETMELRLAHYAAIDSPADQAAQEFARLVEERTDGRIVITLFPNGQLGGVEANARDLARGALDLALLTPGSLAGLDPLLDIHYLPFIATDYEQVDAIFYNPDGVIQKTIRETLAKHDIETLGLYELEFRAVTNSRHPIETPDDLEGLKLRVPSSAAIKGFFEAAGAQTVVMPFPELFTALQQGTVDGQDNGAALTYESQLFETQEYMTTLKHVYAFGTFNASAKLWSELSEEDKQIMLETAQEVGERQIQKNREINDQYLAKLAQAGLEITHPNEQALAAFFEIGQQVWDELTPVYGEARINALREEVARARSN